MIPALGFYEGHVNPDASEQPYYIHPDHQDVFGFAGLWAQTSVDANTVTECCSSITLHSNGETLPEPLETGIDWQPSEGGSFEPLAAQFACLSAVS